MPIDPTYDPARRRRQLAELQAARTGRQPKVRLRFTVYVLAVTLLMGGALVLAYGLFAIGWGGHR